MPLVGDGPPAPAPAVREPLRLPAPTTPLMAFASSRPSCGQVFVAHCDIGAGATIEEVASDLRNLAPTVLIASCSSTQQAERLGARLSEATFGTPTRGNGVKGRSPKEEYQERLNWISHQKILVAGRGGIVKGINNEGEWKTPCGGSMFMAEIDFGIDV